jgi:hypothetical protein
VVVWPQGACRNIKHWNPARPPEFLPSSLAEGHAHARPPEIATVHLMTPKRGDPGPRPGVSHWVGPLAEIDNRSQLLRG